MAVASQSTVAGAGQLAAPSPAEVVRCAVQPPSAAMMFLRVKRQRPTAAGGSADETDNVVTLRCRDVRLPSSLAEVSKGMRQYTFERVVESAKHLPPLVVPDEAVPSPCEAGGQDADAARRTSAQPDAAGKVFTSPSSKASGSHNQGAMGATGEAPQGVVCRECPGVALAPHNNDAASPSIPASSDGAAGSACKISSALAGLFVDETNERFAETPRGVKVVSSGAEIAHRDFLRRQQHAIAARSALRCQRIGECRGTGSVCIDVTVVGGEEEGGGARDEVYDLYVLRDVGSDEEWENDSDEVEGGKTCLAFDDGEDEFCFDSVDKQAQHLHHDRRRRRDLHAAHVLELVNLPRPNEWVMYADECGMAVVNSSDAPQLTPDNGMPEGADNYVYYDHRHDDEYDSNAEDFAANEYPEEADTDESSGGEHHGCRDGPNDDSEDRSDGGAWPCDQHDDDEEWA